VFVPPILETNPTEQSTVDCYQSFWFLQRTYPHITTTYRLGVCIRRLDSIWGSVYWYLT